MYVLVIAQRQIDGARRIQTPTDRTTTWVDVCKSISVRQTVNGEVTHQFTADVHDLCIAQATTTVRQHTAAACVR